MINVAFSGKPAGWAEYEAPLRAAFDAAGLDARLAQDHPPEVVDYMVFAPNGPVTDFSPYTRCKALLSLWAGVETVVNNPTITQPIIRMVEDSLTRGMVEWVVGHALRFHLGMDVHIHGQDGVWRDQNYPPLARQRPVTVLGLGALGTACAAALAALDFPVTGWSRSAKSVPGVRTLSGDDGLTEALRGAEIVVLLLPDTPATENALNARTLALLAPGACVLNPGRGPLIDDAALLAALDSGQIGQATLDVFRVEPLPVDHPFWQHPRVTVTPHIAATTRAETAAAKIAETITMLQAGETPPHVVDRTAGY